MYVKKVLYNSKNLKATQAGEAIGLLTADLHLSLCFSKLNPQAMPQLCNRLPATSSPSTLSPPHVAQTDLPLPLSFLDLFALSWVPFPADILLASSGHPSQKA